MQNPPSRPAPPRYVPTLTQVISAPLAGQVAIPAAAANQPSKTNEPTHLAANSVVPDPQAIADQLRQQILRQTRQNLNLQLERRVREMVAQLALEHAHRLYEELQVQIEANITQWVHEAVQDALQKTQTLTRNASDPNAS